MQIKTQAIEHSHIQALTALIQAQDRINPLDSASEAWRHEAYKLSIQKKAIEDEAAAQIKRTHDKLAHFRTNTATSIDRELENFSHKISCALMKLELRIDRVQTKISDRKNIIQENSKLTREISHISEKLREMETVKSENAELKKLIATPFVVAAGAVTAAPAVTMAAPAVTSAPGEIGSLLAELKVLEAEARRLDFRAK